jgi:hypothetical protein
MNEQFFGNKTHEKVKELILGCFMPNFISFTNVTQARGQMNLCAICKWLK